MNGAETLLRQNHADDGAPAPQSLLMHEILATKARLYPDRVFTEFDDRSLRYGPLHAEAMQLAAALAAHGVAKGDPVILIMNSRSEYAVLMFALSYLGAVAVPVNPALKGESLRHVLNVMKARTAVIESSFLERVTDVVGAPSQYFDVCIVLDESGNEAGGAIPYAALMATQSALPPSQTEPTDPWGVIFTSGTTGVAKGVLVPHQHVVLLARDMAHSMGVDANAVPYTFNPLFHLNAIACGPLAALLTGAKAVIRSKFPREHLLQDLQDTGATHVAIPPFVVRGLLAQPPQPQEQALSLRVVASYGITPQETQQLESRFNCKLYKAYGSSEMGMICLPQPSQDGSVGKISPYQEVRIVDAEGNDLPPGKPGELLARPRRAGDRMLGYYNMPEETAAAFVGDWYKSGDLGYVDAAGNFWFIDRMNEAIKRRGENIPVNDVEAVLSSFPGVANAAVLGYQIPGEKEEEIRAFLELDKPGGKIDFEALVMHCARNLAYFMVPRLLEVIPALPRNPVGKVEKHKLKSLPLTSATFDLKKSAIRINR
jgi:crotonobetaine/carnitine-CoA ligase